VRNELTGCVLEGKKKETTVESTCVEQCHGTKDDADAKEQRKAEVEKKENKESQRIVSRRTGPTITNSPIVHAAILATIMPETLFGSGIIFFSLTIFALLRDAWWRVRLSHINLENLIATDTDHNSGYRFISIYPIGCIYPEIIILAR
jgi:hypothetical protein